MKKRVFTTVTILSLLCISVFALNACNKAPDDVFNAAKEVWNKYESYVVGEFDDFEIKSVEYGKTDTASNGYKSYLFKAEYSYTSYGKERTDVFCCAVLYKDSKFYTVLELTTQSYLKYINNSATVETGSLSKQQIKKL